MKRRETLLLCRTGLSKRGGPPKLRTVDTGVVLIGIVKFPEGRAVCQWLHTETSA